LRKSIDRNDYRMIYLTFPLPSRERVRVRGRGRSFEDSPELPGMRVLGMRKRIIATVSATARTRLQAVVAHRHGQQEHAWRCRSMLLTAGNLGTAAIMRQTGKCKSVVWRWQKRFMRAGVDSLCAIKPGRRASLRSGTARSYRCAWRASSSAPAAIVNDILQ
jgi:hypothetical protein